MAISKVIAIDGPCGSGKSSIAHKLSESLGVLYIDTGAMFRALGYVCEKNNIDLASADQVSRFLSQIDLEYGKSEVDLVIVNGQNLTAIIREHHVSKLASKISQVPEVRNFLMKFQRSLTNNQVCVMEGRDIGTVVFPDAFCKVFITASTEVRAKRRHDQLVAAGDQDFSLEQIIEDVKKRDSTDINRDVAPLFQAEDAHLLDTSSMSFDEVLSSLKAHVIDKAKMNGFSL